MNISESGILFIKAREGFKARAYKDGRGYSIGHGTYIDTPAEQYLKTAIITLSQADSLLRKDLIAFVRAVNSSIKVSVSQSQFDALCDLCYNLGETNFRKLSLVALINYGATDAEINRIWSLTYITENGVKSDGLVTRRRLESEMYFSGSGSGIASFAVIGLLAYFIYRSVKSD